MSDIRERTFKKVSSILTSNKFSWNYIKLTLQYQTKRYTYSLMTSAPAGNPLGVPEKERLT